MRIRRRLLWTTTICAAGLAVAGDDISLERDGPSAQGGEAAILAPARRPAAERSPAQRPLLDLDRLQAMRGQQPTAELFGVKSWYVPPPAPPAPPPAPMAAPVPVKPTPPPLPFVFMGRLTETDRLSVFLVRNDRVYMAAEGDVIDGTYKLEKIEPRLVTLRYLPLDMAQTLAARAPNE
jgi:hypothetical protein